jgi:hypothetical protein
MLMEFRSGGRSASVRLARAVLVAVSIGSAALAAATGAEAATVTIGSPLTGSYFPSTFSLTGTVANSVLPEAGAYVTSPVTGTVVRWRIMDGTGGPYRLRVLTPGSGSVYTGGTTSAPQTPTGPGVETFTTSLPIQAGQTIGLDNTHPTDGIGNSLFAGATNLSWAPSLGLGEARAASGGSGNELSFNADVEYPEPIVTPPAAPSGPPPPPGPAPPSATCLVPALKGKSLGAARKVLRRADCKLGMVRRLEGVTVKSGKVVKQGPKPGRRLAPGSKVTITLG